MLNAANSDLQNLLRNRTATERSILKTKYVRDVVLDCYQHCFQLEELPESIGTLCREAAIMPSKPEKQVEKVFRGLLLALF